MTESTFNKAKALNDRINYLSDLLDLFQSFTGPDVVHRNKAIASIEIKSMKNEYEVATHNIIHFEPLEEDIAMKLAAVVRKELNEAKGEFTAL